MNQKEALKRVVDLMKPQHTPTPWEVAAPQKYMGITCVWIHGGKAPVLKIEGSFKESVLANAAFIVRAVNNFDTLLKLANGYRAYLDSHDDFVAGELKKQIDEIIAKAGAKS